MMITLEANLLLGELLFLFYFSKIIRCFVKRSFQDILFPRLSIILTDRSLYIYNRFHYETFSFCNDFTHIYIIIGKMIKYIFFKYIL